MKMDDIEAIKAENRRLKQQLRVMRKAINSLYLNALATDPHGKAHWEYVVFAAETCGEAIKESSAVGPADF